VVELTGQEFGLLHEALLDAFIDYEDLDLMLARTGRNLADIAPRGPNPAVVTRLIKVAQTRDWIGELIEAARAGNDTNMQLIEVAAAIGLASVGVDVSEDNREQALGNVNDHLERIVGSKGTLIDAGTFASGIQELERQVCRVEVKSGAFGTGFLIGPDRVLTNHHVVSHLIDASGEPNEIVLRFDFRRLRDGQTISPGIEVRLADDWLVDFEPFSPADSQEADGALPAPNELNYAVLRTMEPIGLQPSSGAGGSIRRWIVPSEMAEPFATGAFLMLVAHLQDGPMAVSAMDDAVVGLNGNGTRVRYRNTTGHGSSGSPVVNRNMDLVALHHARRRNPDDATVDYGEGIPISKIRENLTRKGLDSVFAPPS